MNKADWNRQLDDVIDFLVDGTGFSFSTGTDEESRADFYDKTLYVDSRLHPEKKFYTTLHELGHILIYEDSEQFDRDYPMYVRPEDYLKVGNKKHRVSVVAEEIEAWKRGRETARDLGLFINDDKYDNLMTEQVMSYLMWAAR